MTLGKSQVVGRGEKITLYNYSQKTTFKNSCKESIIILIYIMFAYIK